MYLNTLKPAKGAKKIAVRVGRGIGSGLGKTCGRGHKGQHARSGGFHKVGFEGGQMPLQRRLPKFGFTSRKNRFTEELRLSSLANMQDETIDLLVLKQNGLIAEDTQKVKVIMHGEIKRPVTLVGLCVTQSVRAAIESAGGKVSE